MSAKLLNVKSREKCPDCPVYKEKRELFRTNDAMIEVTVKLQKDKGQKELFRPDDNGDGMKEVTVKLKKRKDKSKTRKDHHHHYHHCNHNISDGEPLVHKTGSWGDLLLRKKKLATEVHTQSEPRVLESEIKVLADLRTKKLAKEVQTESEPPKVSESETKVLEDLKKLSALKVENDLLRQDTATLLQQVDKAKTERQEYITTIKELYELAEVLRHENVILIGTHEEHRTLQEKLIDALGENQVLKNRLQELTIELSKPPPQSTTNNNKQKQQTDWTNKNEDLWKVRDVLKEVKTAIAQEIQGLKTVNVRRSPTATDDDNILELFGSLTGLTEPNGLNDTNAQYDDEIGRILNVNNNNSHVERFDIRSSTQYLDVGDSETHVASRRFVPSPNSNTSSISPRFSTPHSDDEI